MSVPILSDIFGNKPDIAPFHPIDFGASQLKSLLENLKAWPQIQALGNEFQDYMTSAYDKAIPGFSKLLEMGGQSAQDILKVADPLIHGQIPEDVMGQLMRSGAYQALGKGADFIHSLQARDIGKTSLDLINQGTSLVGAGASAAQHWAGLASGLIMNPAGFLITPSQQANLDLQQSLIKREVQQAQNNVNAAPNPIAKGLSDLVAYLTASYISSGRSAGSKPPATMDYSSQTAVNSAQDVSNTDFYGMSSFGTQPSSVANPGNLGTQGIIQGSSGGLGFGLNQGDVNQAAGAIGGVDLPPEGGVTQANPWDPFANSISTWSPGSGYNFGSGYPSSAPGQYYGGVPSWTMQNPQYPQVPFNTVNFGGENPLNLGG